VTRFNTKAKLLQPNREQLERDQQAYRLFLLTELFNFNGLEKRTEGFEYLLPDMQPTILTIAHRSARQLVNYDADRIQKAAAYFHGKLSAAVQNLHQQLPAFIGQSKETAAKADELINWLMERIKILDYFTKAEFTALAYLEVQTKKSNVSTYLKTLNALPNEELYEQILAWRVTIANKEKVMPNMIMSEKTVATIAEKLPATLKALSTIKGVGLQKAAQFGADIIGLIRVYEQQLQGTGAEQVNLFQAR